MQAVSEQPAAGEATPRHSRAEQASAATSAALDDVPPPDPPAAQPTQQPCLVAQNYEAPSQHHIEFPDSTAAAAAAPGERVRLLERRLSELLGLVGDGAHDDRPAAGATEAAAAHGEAAAVAGAASVGARPQRSREAGGGQQGGEADTAARTRPDGEAAAAAGPAIHVIMLGSHPWQHFSITHPDGYNEIAKERLRPAEDPEGAAGPAAPGPQTPETDVEPLAAPTWALLKNTGDQFIKDGLKPGSVVFLMRSAAIIKPIKSRLAPRRLGPAAPAAALPPAPATCEGRRRMTKEQMRAFFGRGQTVVAVAALGSIRSGQSKRCTELYGTVTVRKKSAPKRVLQLEHLLEFEEVVPVALPRLQLGCDLGSKNPANRWPTGRTYSKRNTKEECHTALQHYYDTAQRLLQQAREHRAAHGGARLPMEPDLDFPPAPRGGFLGFCRRYPRGMQDYDKQEQERAKQKRSKQQQCRDESESEPQPQPESESEPEWEPESEDEEEEEKEEDEEGKQDEEGLQQPPQPLCRKRGRALRRPALYNNENWDLSSGRISMNRCRGKRRGRCQRAAASGDSKAAARALAAASGAAAAAGATRAGARPEVAALVKELESGDEEELGASEHAEIGESEEEEEDVGWEEEGKEPASATGTLPASADAVASAALAAPPPLPTGRAPLHPPDSRPEDFASLRHVPVGDTVGLACMSPAACQQLAAAAQKHPDLREAEPGVFMVGRPSGAAGTEAKCGFTATRLTQLSTAGNRLLHNVFQFAQGLLSELGPLDGEGMPWEPKGRVEAVTGPCHPVYNNPWARGDTGVRHAMYTSAGILRDDVLGVYEGPLLTAAEDEAVYAAAGAGDLQAGLEACMCTSLMLDVGGELVLAGARDRSAMTRINSADTWEACTEARSAAAGTAAVGSAVAGSSCDGAANARFVELLLVLEQPLPISCPQLGSAALPYVPSHSSGGGGGRGGRRSTSWGGGGGGVSTVTTRYLPLKLVVASRDVPAGREVLMPAGYGGADYYQIVADNYRTFCREWARTAAAAAAAADPAHPHGRACTGAEAVTTGAGAPKAPSAASGAPAITPVGVTASPGARASTAPVAQPTAAAAPDAHAMEWLSLSPAPQPPQAIGRAWATGAAPATGLQQQQQQQQQQGESEEQHSVGGSGGAAAPDMPPSAAASVRPPALVVISLGNASLAGGTSSTQQRPSATRMSLAARASAGLVLPPHLLLPKHLQRDGGGTAAAMLPSSPERRISGAAGAAGAAGIRARIGQQQAPAALAGGTAAPAPGSAAAAPPAAPDPEAAAGAKVPKTGMRVDKDCGVGDSSRRNQGSPAAGAAACAGDGGSAAPDPDASAAGLGSPSPLQPGRQRQSGLGGALHKAAEQVAALEADLAQALAEAAAQRARAEAAEAATQQQQEQVAELKRKLQERDARIERLVKQKRALKQAFGAFVQEED